MTPLEFLEFADWVIANRPIREFQLYDIYTMCDLVVKRDRVTSCDEFYIRTVASSPLRGGHRILPRNTGAKVSKPGVKVAKQGGLF